MMAALPLLVLPAIQQNPEYALPGVISGVNSGEINLDDYEITDDQKEQVKKLADTVANNVSTDSQNPTQLA